MDSAPLDGIARYRLAPAVVVRVAGAALVLVAGVVVVLSVVAAVTGAPFWPVLLVSLLGVVAVGAGAWWASRAAYVVRLDRLGYRVRLIRGAGADRARWVDVAEASTAQVGGLPCVVVSLRDGRTTTIPMAALAGDRDEFVTRLRDYLKSA